MHPCVHPPQPNAHAPRGFHAPQRPGPSPHTHSVVVKAALPRHRLVSMELDKHVGICPGAPYVAGEHSHGVLDLRTALQCVAHAIAVAVGGQRDR
eukprot:360753-Chlamydomonas_euryale.AAC.8